MYTAFPDVLAGAARMLVDYLMEKYSLDSLSKEELMQTLSATSYQAESLLFRRSILASDANLLCKALNLDLGFTFRDPEGNEVVFFPANNHGLDSQAVRERAAKPETTTPSVIVLDDEWTGE